jgi:RNA polymerase sigma-70 factor, ECF subfamily
MRSFGLQLVIPLGMSSNASASDHDEFLTRLRRGDGKALGEAYDRHHEALRAFARRLIGSNEEAEDLVHETFLTLPGALEGFRGGSSLRTFLISIAVNHARHFVRAAARRRAAMDRFAQEAHADVTGPEREASDRELARALTRALDELPIEQRVAFVLCEVEGRASPEVAQIVEAPEATVRTRLLHARLKLRSAMTREGFR